MKRADIVRAQANVVRGFHSIRVPPRYEVDPGDDRRLAFQHLLGRAYQLFDAGAAHRLVNRHARNHPRLSQVPTVLNRYRPTAASGAGRVSSSSITFLNAEKGWLPRIKYPSM